MDECTAEFLIEANEALAALDNDLVRLEATPDDARLIGSIFRTLHTVKGTCGFLGLLRLGRVAHAGENLLGKLRDGTLRADPPVVSLVLRCIDAIKGIIATLEATGDEGVEDFDGLIAELNLMSGEVVPVQVKEDVSLASDSAELQALFDMTPGPVAAKPDTSPEPVAEATKSPPPGQGHGPGQDKSAQPKEGSVPNQTIRVGIELLETLMTTVSELVLSRNQLLQLLRGESESPFSGPLQRLSMITSELQESVMKTRMQPIGNVWSTLPRIVRDLAVELGKKIELSMEGADTELDRQVLELIKDPLTHMVRNAADHGLETPAIRREAGKQETGRLHLSAYHEGGHIVIKIADDGKGLDAARIRRKAVDSGLVTESEASSMADASVFRFILRPGFSTAAEVTAISGRGVGMDVVRSNIERIGGAIDIESQAGRGSTFTIKIPLTLAIVPALIVGCAGERFAIPQISVVELVRASKSGEHRIEQISDSAVLRLRERLLPLIDLRVVLGLDADEGADDERLIIVTQVGASYFGIIVDRVHDTEEIVVKPVSPLLKSLTVYSGNTILGDGSICMIIDPNGMISRIGRIDLASVAQDSNDLPSNSRIAADENQRLLLVKAGDGMNKAIPLDQIARLEDIEVESIRRSDDGRLLVPYRGSLMPLIHAASGGELKMSGRQPVLVFVEKNTTSSKPRQLGLIVDQIIDIIEHTARVDIESGNPDVIGSAIVAGEPMEILNTEGLMRREFAGWNGMADLAYAIEGAAR